MTMDRCKEPKKPRKPRILILPAKSVKYPWQFHVIHPGKPWKSRHWHTWDEALVALDLRKY